jgi:S-adenosylmethionine synthetase
MFEKVNPCHPDKVADRIAGALVDAAYRKEENPRIAVEVLIGHGVCHIIAESSVHIPQDEVDAIVKRIGGNLHTDYVEVRRSDTLPIPGCRIRCGDNGIFKGLRSRRSSKFLRDRKKCVSHLSIGWEVHHRRGKADSLQANASTEVCKKCIPPPSQSPGRMVRRHDVTPAYQRKLGSVCRFGTGGGLHGKDISKADVSVNIYAWLEAQGNGKAGQLVCASGMIWGRHSLCGDRGDCPEIHPVPWRL